MQHVKCNYVQGSKGQYLRDFPINCFKKDILLIIQGFNLPVGIAGCVIIALSINRAVTSAICWSSATTVHILNRTKTQQGQEENY